MASSSPEAWAERTKKLYGAVNIQSRLPVTGKNVVDETLNKIGCGVFQVIGFLLAAVTSVGFFSQAISYGYINLQVSKQWNLTDLTYATLPATTGATNFVGAFVYSYLTDMYGRVWPYAISMFSIGVFVLASAFSPSFPVLVVMRALAGFSVGGILGLVYPMLIEFLPIKNRGQAGVLLMAAESLGGCITAGLAWWLIPTYPTNGWRYLVIATAILSFVSCAFRLIFYVESPRFQITKNRPAAAWKTFSTMARINCVSLSDLADKEEFMYYCKTNQKTTKHLLNDFVKIFGRRHVVHTLALVTVYTSVFSSYIGMTMFLPGLLQSLKVNPFSGAFIGLAAQIPGVLLVSIITEWPWFGRLNTLRLFLILSATFFFLFAFIQNSLTIPLFTVFLYFSLSPMIALLHTYSSEYYPTKIRAMALSFLDIFVAIFNIWIPFCSGYLLDITPRYPWISPVVWGSMVVIGLLASLALRKETRGEDLNEVFSD